jgi:hypothetical protein
MSILFWNFFNLITDYPERSLDLERDEDCFRPTGAGLLKCDVRVGIAFLIFALPQAEVRARTLQKRRYAKRSAVAVLCAVLSALGRWPRRDTGVVAARTGRLKRTALQ